MLKIAHIINPVKVPKTSDLHIAQPVTFETMRIAKEVAKNEVEVELYTAQYVEDKEIIPDFFIQTPNLNHSILDIIDFKKRRKLPFIKDILDRLFQISNADYFIYTNVDISLQKDFYVSVKKIINKGYDAFAINRRILPTYDEINDLSFLYLEAGEKHPGVDCFVFKRSSYTNYKLGKAIIGANYFGKILNTNLICFSEKYKLFKNLHLTFHLGNDRSWNIKENLIFDNHNKNALRNILLDFKQKQLIKKNEMLEYYFRLTTENKLKFFIKQSLLYMFVLKIKRKICTLFCK